MLADGPILLSHDACLRGKRRGLASLPESVLNPLPGSDQVQRHSLPADVQQAATWLFWRRDGFTPTVNTLKSLIMEQTEDIAEVDEIRP